MLKELPILDQVPTLRKPEWMKIRIGHNKQFHGVRDLIHGKKLNTVCEEAACPNMAECWSRGTATIMIMGDICTRSCGFCNIKTGKPLPLDADEPSRVAETISEMNLKYIVITSVDRDELSDCGSGHFAETIRMVKEVNPHLRLEVLVPDFKGMEFAVEKICEAGPHVYAHNMETVFRMHLEVRPQAKYWRSLLTLAMAKKRNMIVKSGLMVGLGETKDEVKRLMRDLVEVGCDLLTIGQYLQPSYKHLPVREYIHPDLFQEYKQLGMSYGLKHVESGPLVRSSYHAETQEEVMRSLLK